MARRHQAEKRKPIPDPIYNNDTLAKFINCVMRDGKKNLSQQIVYKALDTFAKKVNVTNPVDAFLQALENAKPSLEVKSRRVGGATYQVPVEIAPNRREALAFRWIITHAKTKVGRSMVDGLSLELTDCFQNQGSTVKKKEDTHRMAEANKAFAHYRW